MKEIQYYNTSTCIRNIVLQNIIIEDIDLWHLHNNH